MITQIRNHFFVTHIHVIEHVRAIVTTDLVHSNAKVLCIAGLGRNVNQTSEQVEAGCSPV